MMDKIPDCPNVIFNFLGKRKCFSNQARNALAHCIVKALDMVGFPTFFANCFVTFGR